MYLLLVTLCSNPNNGTNTINHTKNQPQDGQNLRVPRIYRTKMNIYSPFIYKMNKCSFTL